MAAGDLTTLANVKTWLGVTTTTDDAVLARLISAASGFIQTWLNRTIGLNAYSEVRNGPGGTRLVFANPPVTAVSGVTVDGVAIPAATGSDDAGYLFDSRILYLRGHRFGPGVQNVSISYTAGYAVVPPEIEQAAIELVALRYRERDRTGYSSRSLSGESAAFVAKDLPPDVQTVLGKYQKVVPI